MPVENFGYKNAWLAIRTSTAEEVVRVLVDRAAPSEWRAGIDAAYEWPEMTHGDAIFVSPPLEGWVLCVGTALSAFADSRPPAFGQLASRLATELNTEVQFFATHRVVEAHAWAKATPAGLAREFLYVGESGETVTDVGSRTEAESAIEEYPSEDDVMAIAGRWSLDPSDLTSRFPDAPLGVLGHLAIPKPPPRAPSAQTPEPPQSRPWWKLW